MTEGKQTESPTGEPVRGPLFEQDTIDWYASKFGFEPTESALLRYLARNYKGHEAGFDEELAAEQIKLSREGDEILTEISTVSYRLADKLMLNWDSVVSGDVALIARVPQADYTGIISWGQLTREQKRQIIRYVPNDPNWPFDEFWGTNWPPDHTPSHFTNAPVFMEILKSRGLVKGPCESCGKKEWGVKFRSPEKGGRPPLEWSYCPACRLAKERERASENLRRHRERKKSKTDLV